MSLRTQVEAALGRGVARMVPLHGGDLSDVVRADLEGGEQVVAKAGTMVDREARMLREMQAAGVPAPEVLYAGPDLIVLEYLEETPPGPESWRALGAALALAHRSEGECYGWAEDYAFGPVEIRNGFNDAWPAFWAENRLRPFLGAVPGETSARLEALCARVTELLPERPRPALLHGDIWTGNALFSGNSAYLIDPACYRGDAEVDLAMLHLFGQPPAEFLEGYGTLRDGHESRQPIYQLFPALVHLRLFGAGYHGLVSRLLDRAGF